MKNSEFLKNYLIKAKDILKDKKKLEALLEKVLIKLNDLSKDKKSIQEFSEHISLFVRIVESYSSGKYTYVPWKSIALMGGFAEIESDEVIVLVNNAEIGSEINVQEAEQDLKEAKLVLSKFSGNEKSPERIKAFNDISKAEARIQAAKK